MQFAFMPFLASSVHLRETRRFRHWIFVVLGFLSAISTGQASRAETLTIAVASNFAQAMRDIAALYEAETGHTVRLSYGSSGKLAAQIVQGAPFQAFFSADQEKPKYLLDRGVAAPRSRYTYALGGLALWSPRVDANPLAILRAGNVGKLALANPRLAPYGVAALEVLGALELVEATRPYWVQGENIAQTYQFVDSGNAAIGFIARSQVIFGGAIERGSVWLVPQDYHRPIRQDAVLIGSEPGDVARDFMRFVRGGKARAIIEHYGYRTEATAQ